MFEQNYNPLGNVFLSTIVAAIPILTLLYFIALHPHRDARGHKHLGISAPYAAFYGVIAAFLVATLAFQMPIASAGSAFLFGTLSGFLGIIWIIIGGMFLYNMTLISGKFEILKESIIHVSFDRRLQVLMIAFSFGAIIEGTSGFGTPVAIAGAVMVGLGFSPFQSAVLNLLANTAPVAWGAIGTPIVTLATVSGLDQLTLSHMAGRQLPFVSVLVPFWLVAAFVKMEGGTWKQVWEVWPGALVSGLSFAVLQWFASSSASFHLMTDVIAGVTSVVCTALFLRFVWHPKSRFLLRHEREAKEKAGQAAALTEDEHDWKSRFTLGQTAYAWVPWGLLVACCAVWGIPSYRVFLNNLFADITFQTTLLGSSLAGSLSLPVWEMPALHNLVQRMPPVLPSGAAPEAARFTINWLSASGTAVFLAAILSGLVLRLTLAQWKAAVLTTAHRLGMPILVIGQVLGLGFLTRFSGMDAVLGIAFTGAGFMYPFFAAYLGWLGVFLTGSDTASNALFGSLQRITAQQLNLNEVLIVATNSTGGVMGKMIDAQSIMVASAACYDDPHERTRSLGPIFRTVWWHSVAGAAVVGLIALLQAYVFSGMIPPLP
ncbi:MAG: L-lactate permease [Gemmatimonadetes bacterium]|nr:L-lactate permease [Gemmatimonadota bacterium]